MPVVAAARKALQGGDAALAEKKLRALLKTSPNSVDARETLALALLQQGKSDDAIVMLREIATLTPKVLNVHINLGNVLLSLQRHTEALAAFDAAIVLKPDHATAHVCRGVMLSALGRKDEALLSYESALEYEPKNTDALNNAGTLLGELKRHNEAIDHYRRALAVHPDYVEALNNLAVSLAAIGRRDDALESYASAIRLKPSYPDAIKNRAELLAIMGRNQESLKAYDEVMALMPAVAEIYNNRSTVLGALNRHQEALAGYDEALRLKPGYVDALNNRGITLAALRRFDEALQCFRTASSLQPDHVNAHWNEGLTLLRQGKFKEGWEKHEWRWQKPEFEQHKHGFTQPQWRGEDDIAGKTLLLITEQGYGDILHFCRYVPLLLARGAKILLFVPEALASLMQSSFPQVTVLSKVSAFPPFDYHCPLLSLPLAFDTTLETIPSATPYLRVADALRTQWQQRLVGIEKLRVGIVWAGSASHKNDHNRSIAFNQFQKLLQAPNAHFFSLQKEVPVHEQQALHAMPNVTLLGGELSTFADTAAAIEALDLVISVDTSVAHLAAALGKPTWILLPYISDWRWLPGHKDSPWYPKASVYWQPDIDQWNATLDQVANDLEHYVVPARPASTVGASNTDTASFAPLSVDEAVRSALEFHREGNLADAEIICKTVLQIQPQHFDALQLMGTLHLQQNRVDAAIACYAHAIQVKPDHVAALSNLASAYQLANRHDDVYPIYDKVAALAPKNASIPVNRAVSLLAQKRYDEALASLDVALAINPKDIAALNNQGVVLNEQRRYAEAIKSFDAALAEKPDYRDALNNRGLPLIGMNRPEEADAHYLHALSITPDNADIYNNRGLALSAMNRIDGALKCYRKAQELKADYVDPRWNEGLMNLVIGNYANGWRQYEWRFKKAEFKQYMAENDYPVPYWTGREDLKGLGIFVHYEQGLGDVIQFVRYVDSLRALGAKVIVSTPESLRGVLRTSFPDIDVICKGDISAPFSYHIAMMSLPLAFGTTLQNIPARSPYLFAPQDRLDLWQQRLTPDQKYKVGLVWSGNPKHANDGNRSVLLSSLSEVLRTAACDFYALQKEVNETDRAILSQAGITELGTEFEDFSGTAAAIMQLDLVISVDTSVAHLAGALGKPVWLLLPFAPDWRWLLDRDDSPWYPSARLFRQSAIGESADQIRRVADALKIAVDQKKTRASQQSIGNIDSLHIEPRDIGHFEQEPASNRVAIESISHTDIAATSSAINISEMQDRAISEHQAGHHTESIALFDELLQLAPNHSGALFGKGCVLFHLGQWHAAETALRAATLQAPQDKKILNNHGYACIKLKKYEQSIASYGKALDLDPQYFNALSGSVTAFSALNRTTEALDGLRRLLQLDPENLDAQLNQSLMNLMVGNYPDGWRQYECRRQLPELLFKIEFPAGLLVDAASLRGKTVLLHYEQGLGDSIQFIRYLDLLHQAGASTLVIAQPSLIDLFAQSFPHAYFCRGGETLPPIDFHCPLLSLPLAFGTTVGAIPKRTPYLQASAERLDVWKFRIPASEKLKVGLVWSGNPHNKRNFNRSIPLAALGEIISNTDCCFYALQKDIGDEEHVILEQHGVTLLGDTLVDFSDTAAAIEQLDLILTVETSVAHLAGALGKKLWIMLAFEPCWRWMLDRDDSPWYPTARLFRQRAIGEWNSVVRNVTDALGGLATTKKVIAPIEE